MVALVAALWLTMGGSPAAAEENAGFTCAADAGAITWADEEAETYWVYRSPDDGATYQWLGRATSTSLQDPAPRPGVQYQAHYVGIPRSTCTIDAEPAPAQCASGTLEAEDATLAGRFEIGTDPSADGGAYAHVPRGTGGEWNGARTNFIEFCATINEPGAYTIDARVQAASAIKRSFYVTVNEGTVYDFVAPP